jgi:hypothetical protein
MSYFPLFAGAFVTTFLGFLTPQEYQSPYIAAGLALMWAGIAILAGK